MNCKTENRWKFCPVVSISHDKFLSGEPPNIFDQDDLNLLTIMNYKI